MATDRSRSLLISITIGLAALIVFGLLWAFLGSKTPTGFTGWYLFSYAMGLTMIVLPCTLPLAFVIVPLAMGTSPLRGLTIALMFAIGVASMLSLYGVLAALIGDAVLGNASVETVKNWFYFIAGAFAYIFALGEVGLLKVRMPTYSGAAPAFIQRQSGYLKPLFLGLFLGNIGVGCPHPATPFILGEIATSGNVLYGWTLFLVHAIGRIVPLMLLAILAILGINGLSWLVARKDRIERAAGWAMVFVAGFILTLGLFTHAWWVNSGQHTLFEELTQEERFLGVISNRLRVPDVHEHGPEMGVGLFGQSLSLGNWVLVLLWVIPIWWYYAKRRRDANFAGDSRAPPSEAPA